MIEGINRRDRTAAPVRGIDRPRKLVIVLVRPDAESKADLFEVAHAFDALRLGLGLGQGGQEQASENRDDGDDDEQFDQCEGGLVIARCFHMVGRVWEG